MPLSVLVCSEIKKESLHQEYHMYTLDGAQKIRHKRFVPDFYNKIVITVSVFDISFKISREAGGDEIVSCHCSEAD